MFFTCIKNGKFVFTDIVNVGFIYAFVRVSELTRLAVVFIHSAKIGPCYTLVSTFININFIRLLPPICRPEAGPRFSVL